MIKLNTQFLSKTHTRGEYSHEYLSIFWKIQNNLGKTFLVELNCCKKLCQGENKPQSISVCIDQTHEVSQSSSCPSLIGTQGLKTRTKLLWLQQGVLWEQRLSPHKLALFDQLVCSPNPKTFLGLDMVWLSENPFPVSLFFSPWLWFAPQAIFSILPPNMILAAQASSFFLATKAFSLLATKALCFLVNKTFSSSAPRPLVFDRLSLFFLATKAISFFTVEALSFLAVKALSFLPVKAFSFLATQAFSFFSTGAFSFLAAKASSFLPAQAFSFLATNLFCHDHQSFYVLATKVFSFLGTTQTHGHQTLAASWAPWALKILGKFLPHCALSSSALWHPATFGLWPLSRFRCLFQNLRPVLGTPDFGPLDISWKYLGSHSRFYLTHFSHQ